jgi:hypothetical protein
MAAARMLVSGGLANCGASMSGDISQFEHGGSSIITSQLRSRLGELLVADEYARELACSPWDFSVEMDRLLARGLTTSDLRWLVKRGYLNHAREVTGPDDAERQFDSQSHNLAFFNETCFILTAAGLSILRSEPAEEHSRLKSYSAGEQCQPVEAAVVMSNVSEQPYRVITGSAAARPRRSPLVVEARPTWDRESRRFYVGERLVKHFRVPSPNQAAVLDAFQEEDWPQAVDDPLPPIPERAPKLRLRDTIKCLNRNQVTRAILFRGDGTGQRVSWELLIGSEDETAGATTRLAVRHAA